MRRSGPFVLLVLLAHGASRLPLHAATADGLSLLATIILALVPAAVGIGLTIHPPKRGRLTRVLAFICYLAAVEGAGLLFSVPVLVRVGVGVVAVVAFGVWELRICPRRSAMSAPVELPAAVSKRHRKQLQQLAAAYQEMVAFWRPTRGKQDPRLERSFWSHFPEAGEALDSWDAALKDYEAARTALWEWIREQGDQIALATLSLTSALEGGKTSLNWTVNGGYLWLDGGHGIAPVAEDTDVDALKRTYEDALSEARDSPQGIAFRQASGAARARSGTAVSKLRAIRALHVIRGKCELC